MLALSIDNFGQCTVNTNITNDVMLSSSSGGTDNRSALAYNPVDDLYYSVNAGSGSYPLDVYDGTGLLISSNASNDDWRGLFWDNNTVMAFGNEIGGGQVTKIDIDANGLPIGSSSMFNLNPVPANSQACASFDSDLNEIIIWNGSNPVVFYDGSTGMQTRTLTLSIPVTTPISNINSTSIVYGECIGAELGLYDYVSGEVLWFDKNSGDFDVSTSLGAVYPGTDRFNFAYSNNLVWIYDRNANQWISHNVFENMPAAVPTLGQWGMIILSLLLLIFAVNYLREGASSKIKLA